MVGEETPQKDPYQKGKYASIFCIGFVCGAMGLFLFLMFLAAGLTEEGAKAAVVKIPAPSYVIDISPEKGLAKINVGRYSNATTADPTGYEERLWKGLIEIEQQYDITSIIPIISYRQVHGYDSVGVTTGYTLLITPKSQ